MAGDDRVRHCAACDLDVFNVEDMSREEALALIRRKIDDPGARICARLRVRRDGTVVTRDCPVGLARVRKHAAAVWSRVGAAAMLVLTFGALASRSDESFEPRARHLAPIGTARAWLASHAPSFVRPRQTCYLLGDVALPTVPPNVPDEARDLYFRAAFED